MEARRGMDAVIIYAGALILSFFAHAALYIFTTMRLLNEIDHQMDELDAKLAGAIQSVLKELPFGDIEPVNPIQQMIAQLIQSSIQQKTEGGEPPIQVLTRDDKGLFTSSEK